MLDEDARIRKMDLINSSQMFQIAIASSFNEKGFDWDSLIDDEEIEEDEGGTPGLDRPLFSENVEDIPGINSPIAACMGNLI